MYLFSSAVGYWLLAVSFWLLGNDGLNTLFYFDGKERAVYVRAFKEKEPDVDGCTLKMTNRYRKYVWDGRRFTQKR